MKKGLSLIVAMAVTAMVMQAFAGNVDQGSARRAAMEFLSARQGTGKLRQAKPQELWSRAEPSAVLAGEAAYYIVSTDKGFVVVAGDDRARTILAYGDSPLTDVEDLPAGARFWLDLYKRQIGMLQSRPEMSVSKQRLRSSWNHPRESIAPLLHTQWSQTGPFNQQCPKVGVSYCYAGCSAVALAQVMRYWEYPSSCDSLPGYTTRSLEISVPALEGTTFEWSKMLDTYPVLGGYTAEQRDAIAKMMRYVGQAMTMDYKTQGSDADEFDILNAMRFFGYDRTACFVEKSSIEGEDYYPDNVWSAMLWNELKMGRPVIYCAYTMEADSTLSGHAFNVDGYSADDDTYHVNFGWRGTGDGNYALNAFLLSDYQFNIGQMMFLNVMPSRPEPILWVSKEEMNLTCHVGETVTQKIFVAGTDLVSGITVTVNDADEAFSIISSQDMAGNPVITVTYAPQQWGRHSASVTVSSQGAADVTIVINGTASLPVSGLVLLPADSAYVETTSFLAEWEDETPSEYVLEYVLEVASTAEFDETDSCYTVITGIAVDSCYVDSLNPGGTYYYRVKAVYIDGSESSWSNVETVTLVQPEPPHGYQLGDINHDGRVNIEDLSLLIEGLLNPDIELCQICSDVSSDGKIDISDVGALIELILTKYAK